jgi:hypothetical protein
VNKEVPRRRGIVSFIQHMLLTTLLLESTLLAGCAYTSILAFSLKDAVESLSRRIMLPALSRVGEETRTSNIGSLWEIFLIRVEIVHHLSRRLQGEKALATANHGALPVIAKSRLIDPLEDFALFLLHAGAVSVPFIHHRPFKPSRPFSPSPLSIFYPASPSSPSVNPGLH